MRFLDKYLAFITSAFLIIGLFLNNQYYPWHSYSFGVAGILYMIEKRKNIKNFFSKANNKENSIYSYSIFAIFIISFFLFFGDIANENIYIYAILLLLIIMGIILVKYYNENSLKRNLMNKEIIKCDDNSILKKLKINDLMPAVIPCVIVLYLLLYVGIKNFGYVFKTALAIIFVFFSIARYRKNQ